MRRWLVLALLVLAGCGGETTLLVNVRAVDGSVGAETLASLSASVYAPTGSLRRGVALTPPTVPGSVVVRHVPADELRVVVAGSAPDGSRLLGGTRVTAPAGHQTTVEVVLTRNTPDADGDGVPDELDDCPTVTDPDQERSSGAGPGNACGGGGGGDGGAGPDLLPPPVVWTAIATTATTATLRSISGTKNALLIGGDNGTLLRSTDGINFSPVTLNVRTSLTGLWGHPTGTTALVVGDDTIRRSSDDGATWAAPTTVASPSTQYLSVSASTSATTPMAFIAGNGGIWTSSDGGDTWAKPLALSTTLTGVWTSDSAASTYAVRPIDGTTSAAWFRASASWTNITTAGSLEHLWGIRGGDVYACGANGQVFRSTEGTNSWVDIHVLQGAGIPLQAVLASVVDVFVVGDGGAIFHSTDRGATWTREVSGTTQPLYGVTQWRALYYAVGAGGVILRRR